MSSSIKERVSTAIDIGYETSHEDKKQKQLKQVLYKKDNKKEKFSFTYPFLKVSSSGSSSLYNLMTDIELIHKEPFSFTIW